MTTARRSDRVQWYDMLAGVMNAYPAAVRTGVGCWSELVSNTSGYYADVLESLIAAWHRPEQAKGILGDAPRRFGEFVERSGETTERAVLDFNERFTATFRRPPAPAAAGGAETDRIVDALRTLADLAAAEALKLQGTQTPPDFGMLQDQVERVLGEFRAAARGAPRPSTSPSAPPDR